MLGPCKPFVINSGHKGGRGWGPRRGTRTRAHASTHARQTIYVGTSAAAGGCGKSTLLEPFEKIFVSLEKPQVGSTFALSELTNADIILWQDYEHDEKMLRISDLCSLLAGESVGIRKPGKVNTKHRNKAPCFYPGRAAISCEREGKTPSACTTA